MNEKLAWGEIGLVTYCDSAYLQHAATTIHSTLSANDGLFSGVHFVCVGVSTESFAPIQSFLRSTHGTESQLLALPQVAIAEMDPGSNYPNVVFLPLFISEIVPESLNWVLVLASDTLVLRRLDAIEEVIRTTDPFSSNTVIWAVREGDGAHLRRYGFDSDHYFNSGVYLVNLAAWRKQNIYTRLLEIEKKTRKGRRWADQDVLNLAMEGRWEPLPKSYNCGTRDTCDVVHIAHFKGKSKPWMYGCKHPNSADYRFLRREIPLSRPSRSGLWAFLYRKLVSWKLRKKWKKIMRRARRKLAAKFRETNSRNTSES